MSLNRDCTVLTSESTSMFSTVSVSSLIVGPLRLFGPIFGLICGVWGFFRVPLIRLFGPIFNLFRVWDFLGVPLIRLLGPIFGLISGVWLELVKVGLCNTAPGNKSQLISEWLFDVLNKSSKKLTKKNWRILFLKVSK